MRVHKSRLEDPSPNGRDSDITATDRPADASRASGHSDDRLLELLERWEEHYRRGEDATPESLGADPALWDALRALIEDQKRLFAHLDLAMQPADGPLDGSDALPSIPGHEILLEIGRGGMGVVYMARDLELGRIVAIKTIAEGRHAMVDQRERFRAEARAVARLRHPNIIAIHRVDEHEQRPYLSLEYAEGGNLAQRLAERPMAARDAAALAETLARAIQAAHEAGVVHRDLKPSNVLLTAEGIPKVSDFGLAKLLDVKSERTASNQVMGSPSYMSPEQAEGHSKQVGPTADVYSLGAILYQSLTGRPPFVGESALETLKLVSTTEVVAPRLLRPDVPRDLETICLKCLEKEPSRRYDRAIDMADDLRRYLEGRPIAARPVGPADRLWRWCRRNPKVASLAAALLLTFALGTPTLLALWLQARADRARAETEAANAKSLIQFLSEDMLSQAGPQNQFGSSAKPDPNITVRTTLDRAAAKIGDRFTHQPEQEALIRKTIGETYQVLGLFTQAHSHLAASLKLRRGALGDDHINTLESEVALAKLDLLDGNLEEARPLLDHAVERLRVVRGPEHLDTLSAMNVVGQLRYYERNYPEAEKIFRQLRDGFTRAKGPDDLETLGAIHDLGMVYKDQERPQLALPLLKQAATQLARTRGDDDPCTLSARRSYAEALERLGRVAEMEPMLDGVLKAQREVLGADHPDTARSLYDLGHLYRTRGQIDKAEAFLKEAEAGARAAIDPNHEVLAAVLAELAVIYLGKQGPEEARPGAARVARYRGRALRGRQRHDREREPGCRQVLFQDGGTRESPEILPPRAGLSQEDDPRRLDPVHRRRHARRQPDGCR